MVILFQKGFLHKSSKGQKARLPHFLRNMLQLGEQEDCVIIPIQHCLILLWKLPSLTNNSYQTVFYMVIMLITFSFLGNSLQENNLCNLSQKVLTFQKIIKDVTAFCPQCSQFITHSVLQFLWKVCISHTLFLRQGS